MNSHVILYGGDRSPHRSIGNTRLVFWTETNFLPDFSICYTVLKDSSYPGSIRNVVYAWNTADRNTVAHPAEEEQTYWCRAWLCVYRHWQWDGYNIGCDTGNVAVRLGFVQVWFVSVVWNAADCKDSQDQWQSETYPHVYREYVEETTPPFVFYSTRRVPG